MDVSESEQREEGFERVADPAGDYMEGEVEWPQLQPELPELKFIPAVKAEPADLEDYVYSEEPTGDEDGFLSTGLSMLSEENNSGGDKEDEERYLEIPEFQAPVDQRHIKEDDDEAEWDERPLRHHKTAKSKSDPKTRRRSKTPSSRLIRSSKVGVDEGSGAVQEPPKKLRSRTPGSGGRRSGRERRDKKERIEMTEEMSAALKEKWRNEKRKQREALAALKVEKGDEKDATDNHIEDKTGGSHVEVEQGRRMRSSGRRKQPTKSEAKRRRTSSPRDPEVLRAKWREETRKRRQRAREEMTPEEREQYLAKQREQKRKYREQQKKIMTPEKRQEERQKRTMRRIIRLANMTDEERQEQKMRNSMAQIRKQANISQEEIERKKREKRERDKARQLSMTPEEKERRKEKLREARRKMTGERRQRFLDNLRKYARKRWEKLRQDPEKLEEEKNRANELRRIRKARMRVGDKPPRPWKRRAPASTPAISVKDVKVKESGDVETTKPRRKRIDWKNATAEELEHRRREIKRLSNRKFQLKKKLKIQSLIDSGVPPEQIQERLETPEQRERRLLRTRINDAKRRLRRQLETSGCSAEEIEKRLEQFAATYKPPPIPSRPYKAYLDNRRRVDPSELAKLEMIEQEEAALPPSAFVNRGSVIAASTSSKSKSKANTGTILPSRQRQQAQKFTVTSTAPSCSSSSHAGSVYSPVSSVGQEQASPPQPGYHQHYQDSQGYQQTFHRSDYVAPPTSLQPAPSAGYSGSPTIPGLVHLQHQPQYQNIMETLMSYQPPDYATYNHQYPTQPESTSTSPPPTPAVGSDFGDADDYMDANYEPLYQPPPAKKPRGPPRKPRSKKAAGDPKRPLRGPRGPKRNVTSLNRNTICDLCGNGYNQSYIKIHKERHHNPNFVNGKCLLCSMIFPSGREFFKHYKSIHMEKAPYETAVPVPDCICYICGGTYKKPEYLKSHLYWVHGDGAKKENWMECHVCHKNFKLKITLRKHIKDSHPEEAQKSSVVVKHECMRCHDRFSQMDELKEHVKTVHPESNFPCLYCSVINYTEASFKFHLTRCVRIPKEEKKRLLGLEDGDNDEGGGEGKKAKGLVADIVKTPLECEVCGKMVAAMSLKRHYFDVHGVKEDLGYQCDKCCKMFKRREYYVVHMDGQHGVSVEEVASYLSKMNVQDRDKLTIQNPNGKWGTKREEIKKKKEAKNGSFRQRGVRGSGRKRGASRKKIQDEIDCRETKEEIRLTKKTIRKQTNMAQEKVGAESRLDSDFVKIKKEAEEDEMEVHVVRLSESELEKYLERSSS